MPQEEAARLAEPKGQPGRGASGDRCSATVPSRAATRHHAATMPDKLRAVPQELIDRDGFGNGRMPLIRAALPRRRKRRPAATGKVPPCGQCRLPARGAIPDQVRARLSHCPGPRCTWCTSPVSQDDVKANGRGRRQGGPVVESGDPGNAAGHPSPARSV